MYFAQCSFAEMKYTFIELQNEPLPKNIGQVLLIVNNSVNVSHFFHRLESVTLIYEIAKLSPVTLMDSEIGSCQNVLKFKLLLHWQLSFAIAMQYSDIITLLSHGKNSSLATRCASKICQ